MMPLQTKSRWVYAISIAAPSSIFRSIRTHAVIRSILALPGILLLIDPSWFISPLLLDPFIYFGYYQNLPTFIRAFPSDYYGTRLPVLLPGWLAHQALPPLVANAVLRLGLYYTCIFGLYGTLVQSHGRRAAFIAAVLLGTSPFFLGAVGWDYADGFGLAYAFTAHWLLARSRDSFATRYRLAAGFALACLVFANLFYVVFAFFVVAEFLLATPSRGNEKWRALATISIGVLAATLMMMSISRALGGRFLFFMGSLGAGQK